MKIFIVTIRLPKKQGHDPHNKKVGTCPVSRHCTDVTGEHHSFIVVEPNPSVVETEAASLAETLGGRITRIEQSRIDE